MKKIKLLACVFICGLSLVGCNNSTESTTKAEAAEPQKANIQAVVIPKVVEAIETKWARTCALCHATGVGGAPRIGMSAEWQPRLAQGKDVLLAHTIDGFNDMPSLGYCMSCDREDFSQLIDFMAGESQ